MSEIEKQFFDTFGIKPKRQCYYWDCPYSTGEIEKDTPINQRDCANCTNPDKEVYPQITDHILLELICLNDIYLWLVHLNTVDELKNILLGKYIEHVNLMADENEKQEYIHQVQAIFKKE